MRERKRERAGHIVASSTHQELADAKQNHRGSPFAPDGCQTANSDVRGPGRQ